MGCILLYRLLKYGIMNRRGGHFGIVKVGLHLSEINHRLHNLPLPLPELVILSFEQPPGDAGAKRS